MDVYNGLYLFATADAAINVKTLGLSASLTKEDSLRVQERCNTDEELNILQSRVGFINESWKLDELDHFAFRKIRRDANRVGYIGGNTIWLEFNGPGEQLDKLARWLTHTTRK